MNLRLRSAVLSAVAVVAAGLFNVTTSAPAGAAGDGDTCMDPVVTGTVKKVAMDTPSGYPLNAAEFSQSGFTSANCPTAFVDYRYRVHVAYNGQTTSTYHSKIEPVYRLTPAGLVRSGTRIVFPTMHLGFAGYKDVTVTVTAGSKSVFSSTWCRSNEEAYDYVVPAEEWVGYETIDGVPRARTIACP